MKRSALLLCLLFVAALSTTTGSQDITATYDEDITYIGAGISPDPYLLPLALDDGTQSAQTITQTFLRFVLADYTYAIIAADAIGNQAVHDVRINGGGDLEVTMLSPSENGFTDRSRFPVRVRTGVAADCEWAWAVPGSTRQYEPMSTEDREKHEIPGFQEAHRFSEGEAVPVTISCAGDDATTQVAHYGIGWTQDPASVEASLWPSVVTRQGQPVRIEVTSDQPTRCEVYDGQETLITESQIARYHRFEGLSSSPQYYSLRCEDALGEELPQQELNINQDYATAALEAQLKYPLRSVDTTDPVIAVETNKLATCTADFGTPIKLGALSQGTLHQRVIPLEESASGTVTCTSGEDSVDVEVDITIDMDGPSTVFSKDPTICSGSQDVLLEVASGEDTRYVIIEADGKAFVREWPADSTQTLIRQGGLALAAGDSISLTGIDSAGNRGETDTVSVTANPPAGCEVIGVEQTIELVNPPGGAAEEETFTLIVNSEFPSTCSWSVDGEEDQPFTETGETSHEEEDFGTKSGLTSAKEVTLRVTCEDEIAQSTSKEFLLAYDLAEPSISLSADPDPVTDVLDRSSTITVDADQQVRCQLDEGGFTPEYSDTHTFDVSIPFNAQERTFEVSCENLLEGTGTDSITISENYPSTMTISIEAPSVTQDTTIPMNVSTTIPASCTVVQVDETLDTEEGFKHEGEFELEEGKHELTVRCQEENGDKTKDQNKTILVDGTPPRLRIASPLLTCGLDEYVAYGNVTDAVSGPDSVEVEFLGENYSTKEFDEGRWRIKIENINLTAGRTYTLLARATDKAGNLAEDAEARIGAERTTSGACDINPPRAKLYENEQLNGTIVELGCQDEEGTCDDDYEIGFADPEGKCSLSAEKFSDNETWALKKDTKVCWKVADIAGNTDEDSTIVEVINFSAILHCNNEIKDRDETGVDCGGVDCIDCSKKNETNTSACIIDAECPGSECKAGVCSDNHCSNGIKDDDETDVDCGGADCQGCEIEQTCKIALDCTSNSCEFSTCIAPSCTDQKVNGDETDADCGGSCDAKCAIGKRCKVDADCETNICSSGVCSQQELETQYPDNDTDDPYVPPEEESNLLAWIFIIIGILLSLGGGGYIVWEQQHPQKTQPKRSSALTQQGSAVRTDPFGGQAGPTGPAGPAPDFASSKLREEARKKRQAAREGDRKELLSEFEGSDSQQGDEDEKDD